MENNDLPSGPLQQLILMLESNQENLFRALAQASTDQGLQHHATSTAKNVGQLITFIKEMDMDITEIEELIIIAKNNIRL